MRARYGIIVLAIAAVVLGRQLSAQGSTPSVSAGDSVRSGTPGTAISWMFNVRLSGSGHGTVELILPTGWHELTEAGDMPPGSRAITYVAGIAIPSTALPGRYPI